MLNLFPNLNASPSNGLTAYLNEISQSVELNADKSIDSAYMEDLHLLEEIVANVDDSIDATYKRYLGLIDSSKPEVNPSVDSTYAVDYSPTVDVKSEVLPSMDSAYKQSLAFCDSAYLIVQTIRMCIYKARLDLHITSIADVTPTKEMQLLIRKAMIHILLTNKFSLFHFNYDLYSFFQKN